MHCKFYQTGYCKFKEACKKKNEHEICKDHNDCSKENCTKRHPKTCRNFSRNGKCFYKERCAYKHTVYVNDQVKVIEAMMLLILKQQQEISSLTEELNSVKVLVETMAMAKKPNNKDKEVVEIIAQENHKVSEKVYQCQVCDFECPKEETLKKHTNTRHKLLSHEKTDERKFYCHECNVSFKTKKSLKKHEQCHSDIVKKNCSDCDFECTSEKDIRNHMNVNHMKGLNTFTYDIDNAPEVDEAELDEWIAKAAEASNVK